MALVQLLRYSVEEIMCDFVLRENSIHKAMQEDTIATQTNNYIYAKPRTILFMSPVQFLAISIVLLVHFSTSTIRAYLYNTFQYYHDTGNMCISHYGGPMEYSEVTHKNI